MIVSKILQTNIFSSYSNFKITKKASSERIDSHFVSRNKDVQPIFFQLPQPYQTVHFKGAKVHILDGGIHGKNMKYFAKSLNSNIEVNMHNVEINSKDKYTKQLKSLLNQLRKLNERKTFSSVEYVAIPCLSTVPLLNIQDQYKKVMGYEISLTPENIKTNKEKILRFLKIIHDCPDAYREYINYMDSINCGIEYTYGVIQEINKLKNKCYNVYVPSGHPADLSLKWMADERGLKPELYHYIATGEDIGGVIKGMQSEIKEKNWYSFNLLALSDAHIVGLKDTDWTNDFIFAGYDSCITESARGVYNFTPIRNNNKVLGYSFHDEKTNEYPYFEFPMNEGIMNLLEFVGKDKKHVLASKEETDNFNKKNQYQRKNPPYNRKLYKIEDVLSQSYIKDKKINLLGKYTDHTLKVFYDENKDGKIIFKKTDCEGSGRPGVLTMWGSCFALFNAISNNIDLTRNYSSDLSNLSVYMHAAMNAKKYNKKGDYIKYLFKAAEAEKIQRPEAMSPEAIQVYEELADVYINSNDYKKASGCLNRALYLLANQFYAQAKVKNLADLKHYHDIYSSSYESTKNYLTKRREYINASFIEKLFISNPIAPSNYDDYKKYEKENNEYFYYNYKFMTLFNRLSRVCKFLNELYPAKICSLAAKDIEEATSRGVEIIKRRKEGNIYIGDLYSEAK